MTEPPPIEPDEPLWRLLLPAWIVPPEKGGPRVSSAAFKDTTRETCEVSVFRKRLMSDDLRRQHAQQFEKAAEIMAAKAIELGHQVRPDSSDDQDPSHAVIIPPDLASKALSRGAKNLAIVSRIVLVAP